jgi:DNA-binding IclR family transcriptional regulator
VIGAVSKRPRGRPRSPETSSVAAQQSADRVLSVLELFADEHPDLRVGEVASGLAVSESTASRLLALLETRGYVQRDPSTGMYSLGWQVLTQAGVAMNRSTIRRAGLEEMARLVNSLGLGANLAVLHRGAVFYLGNLDGRHAPRYYTLLGRHYPVHATALGKALLAWQENAEVDAILAGHAGFAAAYLSQRQAAPQPGELRRYTANTIRTTSAFHACLALVRRQGYSTEREELAMGRACVAAPIRGRNGAVIAGLSISGPERIVDLANRESELAAAAVDAAMRISERLGFVLPPDGERVGSPAPATPMIRRTTAASSDPAPLEEETVWDQSAR